MCNANHTDLLLHHHHHDHDHDQRWYSTTGGDARRSRARVRGGVFFRSTWAQPNHACQVDPPTSRGHSGGQTDLLDECGCLRQGRAEEHTGRRPPTTSGRSAPPARRIFRGFTRSRATPTAPRTPPGPEKDRSPRGRSPRRGEGPSGPCVLPIDLPKTTTLVK